MDRLSGGPLDDVDDDALYQLLGDAWYAQSDIVRSNDQTLPTAIEVGQREYQAVAPLLREALRQPYFQGLTARIESVLQVEATWIMPSEVIVALTRRHGLV